MVASITGGQKFSVLMNLILLLLMDLQYTFHTPCYVRWWISACARCGAVWDPLIVLESDSPLV
jgi:hypothetical protein